MEFLTSTGRIAPAARITVQDSYMAQQWGFTDWQWAALTHDERRDYRDRIVYAPNFNAEGK